MTNNNKRRPMDDEWRRYAEGPLREADPALTKKLHRAFTLGFASGVAKAAELFQARDMAGLEALMREIDEQIENGLEGRL